MKRFSRSSDAALWASLERLARQERRNMPRILARLAELDKRKALPRCGGSLFDYCLKRLHWSESDTAKRIHVARAADAYREIYSHLWTGKLTIATAALLAPHLTPENRRMLIPAALRQSKRAVEALVATIAPAAERPERIRPLGPQPSKTDEPSLLLSSMGEPQSQEASCAPPADAAAAPPPPSRVELTFAVDEPLARELEDARALLRNKYPFCRLEDVFREALRALLERLDPERRPEPAARPGARKAGRRRIPPAVRAYVWKRDKGRCAYVGPAGERCGSRAFLEFDHIRPFSLGGRSDTAANVRLLCRSHNIHMSRRVFGFI
jgi:hypothetical protein